SPVGSAGEVDARAGAEDAGRGHRRAVGWLAIAQQPRPDVAGNAARGAFVASVDQLSVASPRGVAAWQDGGQTAGRAVPAIHIPTATTESAMMRPVRYMSVACLALALTGCASAPIHFYTLVPPASAPPAT